MNTIFITGGTGKIGGQLVAHFYTKGWKVVTTSRTASNIYGLVERKLLSEAACAEITVLESDFTQTDAVDKIMSFFKNNPLLQPKVLVNNARSLDFCKINEDGFSERYFLMNEYLINTVIPYELSTQLSNLANSPLKKVINISSIYGIVPVNPNLYGEGYEHVAPIQYGLSKAAVIHLTKELAIRFAKKIQVNTVSYGGVKGRASEEFEARYAKLCPEGVMLTEAQTIGPIDFLASDNSNGITGQNLVQDGGWSVW